MESQPNIGISMTGFTTFEVSPLNPGDTHRLTATSDLVQF